MSTPFAIGVPAYDLRLQELDRQKRAEPYALVVGVADCRHVTEVAAGTRRQMRDLRTRLLIALRGDREALELVASALAGAVRRLPAETPEPEEPTR